MIKEYLSKYICSKTTSVFEAMEKIDANAKGILFVTDNYGKLIGSITDGDIRRFMTSRKTFDAVVDDAMNRTPLFIEKDNQLYAERIISENHVTSVPVVSADGKIFDIIFSDEIFHMKKSVYIIAEAGVNHNGSYELACRLADAAKEAGADCVKYQTFNPDQLTSKFAQKADYQKRETGNSSQKSMLESLLLTHDEFRKLKSYCDSIGITFESTPFDTSSLEFLKELDLPFWKIPSGELTNTPFLVDIAKTKKPVILSTGMSSMQEVEEAVNILMTNGASEVKLLHCNTEYPTPIEDVNLSAMVNMGNRFDVEVGYSDHTQGIVVPIAATAMGASVIEKHFTLDRNMEGPDHKASLEPDELREMVKCIRQIESAMGSGLKVASPSEIKNMTVARKSIVAKKNIKKGEILTEDNITTKRPGNGISPTRWYDVLGTKATRDFMEDELIE